MEQLKYTRSKRSQIAEHCPCGRSNRDGKFVVFEGFTDKGYCHSCNQSFFPEDNIPVKPDPGHMYSEKIEQKFIDTKILTSTFGGYDKNKFVQWLTNLVDIEPAKKIISRFCVGTSRNNGTVFWTINQDLKICQPKVFSFNSDGHRDKYRSPTVPKSYTRDNGYIPCLFGLHQLNPKYGNTKPIALVESEKSACLGFHAFPRFNFIALGSSTLSQEKAQPLRGYQVVIIPDSDPPGRDGARKTRERLSDLGISSNICDLFPDKDNGYDIADFLAEKLKPKSVDRMIDKNPAIKMLIERFELEEVN